MGTSGGHRPILLRVLVSRSTLTFVYTFSPSHSFKQRHRTSRTSLSPPAKQQATLHTASFYSIQPWSRGDMQPCVTRARHSSCRISSAVPHATTSNYHVSQLPPSLRVQSPVSPAERMSSRRLSWRRRREASTSSIPSAISPAHGHYLHEPGFAPLHRSLSEASPVSPLSDRSPIIDADSRRLSRMGFVRRPPQQDTAFMTPVSYTGPFFGVPAIDTSASGPWQPYRPQTSYDTQANWGYSNRSSNDLYDDDRSTTYSQVSSQQTFMTSPTSYAGSTRFQSATRPHTSSRTSRPFHSTYPPAARPITIQREDEDEFTSPTDFALFAEATSSLDITPLPSPNPALNNNSWSTSAQEQQFYSYASPPVDTSYISPMPSYPYSSHRPTVSASRLAAPLPPIPHNRSSSTNSPALALAPPPPGGQMRRQQSRSQMLAEALTGLGLEDSRVGSSDEDDELPNYEQSQAEVAARKRREAAARARELEEGWNRARRGG